MVKLVLILFASLIPTLLWAWLYIFFKREKRVIPFSYFIYAFGGGLVLAGIAVVMETIVRSLSNGVLEKVLHIFSTSPEQFYGNLKNLIFIYLLDSLMVALLETSLQYYFLKKEIETREGIEKVMDGVQFSIVMGFGFFLVKDAFFLFQASNSQQMGLLFFQSLVIGLAYSLISGLLGYFMSLARFHKLYRQQFIKRSFLLGFLFYGLLHFFLLKEIFYYTVWLLIIAFVVLVRYLIERRNFEIHLIHRERVTPPLLHEKREIITFLFNEKLTYYEMKQLAFCPKCFIIKKPEWRTCPYCGLKF